MKYLLTLTLLIPSLSFAADLPKNEKGEEVVLNSGIQVNEGIPTVWVHLGPLRKKIKERVENLTQNEGESDGDYKKRRQAFWKVLCAEAAKDWLDVYVRKINNDAKKAEARAKARKKSYDRIEDKSDNDKIPDFKKPKVETTPSPLGTE